MNWLIRLYAALSRLTERPHRFRAKFRDEMQSVFADAVNDAAKHGLVALLIVCAREMWELPAVLVRDA